MWAWVGLLFFAALLMSRGGQPMKVMNGLGLVTWAAWFVIVMSKAVVEGRCSVSMSLPDGVMTLFVFGPPIVALVDLLLPPYRSARKH
ncbi:hypothetical protein HY091_01400 [Candidatus Kaiserbacteria bacterium]|nr:hypothetical protein [Candidatus Kaiserbacteria bacterium]